MPPMMTATEASSTKRVPRNGSAPTSIATRMPAGAASAEPIA